MFNLVIVTYVFIPFKMILKELENPLALETDLYNGLKKEVLSVNDFGTYFNTSVIGCNTRKYHGLFVTKQPQLNHDNYVMLSSLLEKIKFKNREFSISTHQFPNTFFPKGYRHNTDFSPLPYPQWHFFVEGIKLEKSIEILPQKNRVLIKYLVQDAPSNFYFNITPLLAFRNAHQLSKSNTHINSHYYTITNGCAFKLYEDFDYLNLQFSKRTKYVHAPDWYYNFEYEEEKSRGYPYREDLLAPGSFEICLKKGDELILSVGLNEVSQSRLSDLHSKFKKENDLLSYEDLLNRAANQFINKTQNGVEICAGYPWFGPWGRDTFISLTGLTLCRKKNKLFLDIVNTYLIDLKNGLFPNIGSSNSAAYNSVDSSLWFFKAMSEYAAITKKSKKLWETYSEVFKTILNAYRYGTQYGIVMHENGLIYAEKYGKALTWMDAVTHQGPITQRAGYCVEINALWYNAVSFVLNLAQQFQDKDFIKDWKHIPELTKQNFQTLFWNDEKGYLADVVSPEFIDWSIRPNQIVACAVIHSPLGQKQKEKVMQLTQNELLTPRGLRTLSEHDPKYIGVYEGTQEYRDNAYHNGTIWPWLLAPFAEGWVNTHGFDKDNVISDLYSSFEEVLFEYGLLSIPEIFDGQVPHFPKGTISQAWSVSALIRMKSLIDNQ